ncbi:MAG TPA: response regulator [Candidatus Hydrogenedentes bacterium]|nr:response regulator [Candidatus Hydrogenedentota bacterium]
MALNILVVDDSATVRAVIAKTLQLSGVAIGAIHTAANGEEALSVMKEQWIDLVFSDINMPVMGGIEMIQHMHRDAMLRNIPVVVVSTEGSAARIEQMKAQGVRAYIRKPFTPEMVRTVVEEIVGPHAEEPEQPEDEKAKPEELLKKTFTHVLEQYAFLFGDPLEESGPPSEIGACLCATMEFVGPINGTLALAMPAMLCQELASNVLGLESDDAATEAAAADALKELLNITCGNLLTALAGDQVIFDLSVPEIQSFSNEQWQAWRAVSDTVAFTVEDELVLLRLELQKQR